jgi:hypothetical protein
LPVTAVGDFYRGSVRLPGSGGCWFDAILTFFWALVAILPASVLVAHRRSLSASAGLLEIVFDCGA